MESDRKVKLRKSSNDVMLPNCFVISGYPICTPCDAKGIPLKDPIVVMAPQSPDWKPLHMFNQVSATRYMCLECKSARIIYEHWFQARIQTQSNI